MQVHLLCSQSGDGRPEAKAAAAAAATARAAAREAATPAGTAAPPAAACATAAPLAATQATKNRGQGATGLAKGCNCKAAFTISAANPAKEGFAVIRVIEPEHCEACRSRGAVEAFRQRSPAARAYLDALVAMNMGRPHDEVIGLYQRHMARAEMAETGLDFSQLQARRIGPRIPFRSSSYGLCNRPASIRSAAHVRSGVGWRTLLAYPRTSGAARGRETARIPLLRC